MKKQKRFSTLIIVLLIVAAVAAIAGGIFLYQKMTPAVESNPPHNTLPAATTSQASVIPADWKMVSNNNFNFSLQYPSDFFGAGHEPKILSGDCNYQVFPAIVRS